MIEANEDISLVTEQQVRDVEQGQAQARAIAEGREVHPAILAAQAEADNVPPPPETAAIETHTIQRPAGPPPDPDAAKRHLRLSIAVIVVLVLFLLWLRQRAAHSAR